MWKDLNYRKIEKEISFSELDSLQLDFRIEHENTLLKHMSNQKIHEKPSQTRGGEKLENAQNHPFMILGIPKLCWQSSARYTRLPHADLLRIGARSKDEMER